MYHCNNCNLDVDSRICPLCHNSASRVEGEGEASGFPFVKSKISKRSIILKLYFALQILFSIILLMIDYHFTNSLSWSIIGLSSIFLGYLILKIFFNDLNSFFAKFSKTLLSILLYLIFLDLVLLGGIGWSLNFIFPSFILLENFLLLLFMLINRNSYQRYLIMQIVCILLSFVSYSLSNSFVLSIFALGISSGIFVFTLLLGGFKSHSEMKRRFHINPDE